MTLTNLQVQILKTIANARTPESYVAGASTLNVDAPRLSEDLDIFHDDPQTVEYAAELDATLLRNADFTVRWTKSIPSFRQAIVEIGDEQTKLEWARDSDFRFFPTMKDKLFGYRLHPFDLATNKLLAAAGRGEARDLVDLAYIDRAMIPIGAVAWAAVGKSPGFTPEGLIAEIQRYIIKPASSYRSLASQQPIDPIAITRELTTATERAYAFLQAMPSEQAGTVYLTNGQPVQPEPDRLAAYQHHVGSRKGHWPSNPDIDAAMFDASIQTRRPPRQ